MKLNRPKPNAHVSAGNMLLASLKSFLPQLLTLKAGLRNKRIAKSHVIDYIKDIQAMVGF
jgi:hypothetical protein